ncbi:MAG: ABC transporter substrate-binding protein [Bacillota bacterium]
MNGRRNLITALLVISISSILLLSACGKQDNPADTTAKEKIVIQIGYLPITHSLPLVVAEKLDGANYKNIELKLVRFSSWPELTDAFNSGQLQGVISMFELAMVGQQRGIPQQIVALSHRNGDVLVVNNQINDVKELKGKTIAIPHRLSGHNILLYKALKDAGIGYDEVQKVEMAPPDMPATLARGEVDAYIVAEPFGAQSVISGQGKVLKRAQDIWPGWICCGLIVDPKLAQENPEAVEELVHSLMQAGQYINDNRSEAVNIAAEKLQIKPELWEKSLEWIDYSDLTPKVEDFAKLQDYLMELPWDGKPGSLLGNKVNMDELLNTSFAEKEHR